MRLNRDWLTIGLNLQKETAGGNLYGFGSGAPKGQQTK